MSTRTGLGPLEEALVLTLDDLGVGPQQPRVRSSAALVELERRFAVAPRYGYQVACDLAHRSTVWLRLLDGRGNLGGLGHPPAEPHCTELRLTPVGALAAAAERDDGPALPIGIVNGSVYAGGQRPPFAPRSLLRALVALLDDPTIEDDALVGICGPPVFPTGCDVSGDVEALLAGRPAVLRLTARVVPGVERGKEVLHITNLPPGVERESVLRLLEARVETRSWEDLPPELAASMRLPIAGVHDMSTDTVLIRCRVAPGADLTDVGARLRELWGVYVDVPAALPHSLPMVLRRWAADRAEARTGATLRHLLALYEAT